MGFQIGFPALKNYPPSGVTYDADAQNYIDRVETADAAALETATKDAINNLFLAVKASGVWSPQVYSLPLCGPRTIDGAMVPMQDVTASSIVGNLGWDRKNGIYVNDSSGSNYVSLPAAYAENTVGTQNDFSMSVVVVYSMTQANGGAAGASSGCYLGANNARIFTGNSSRIAFLNRSGTQDQGNSNKDQIVPTFRGSSRDNSADYAAYDDSGLRTCTRTSATPPSNTFRIFNGVTGSGSGQCALNTQISWAHIGTDVDLTLLRTAVLDYRAAISTAF